MIGADRDLIRVFEHDPDLLEGLEAPVAAHLRQRLAARRTRVEPGRWEPDFGEEDIAGHLGLLVIEGLLIRTVVLAGRECSEVVGPGDLIRPWDREDALVSVPCHSTWRVLQPATFAVLDAGFALRIARWPTITARLFARGTRRCRTLIYQATIAHVRHAQTRVLLALWHLADRWGRVTADGIRVPVPLTHQLLAQITCLQRPTVSAAISHLTEAGAISRAPDGGWVLHGEAPAFEDGELPPAHPLALA
jgi:CRP/FNR family cyclic AMP-dependent transcriptional regulator